MNKICKINGRTIAKCLICNNEILKETKENFYFSALHFEKIKQDEWFVFEYPYVKINKNKLYGW